MTALRGTTTGPESSSAALMVPAVSGTQRGDLIPIFAAAEAGVLGPTAGFRRGDNTQSGNTHARAHMRTDNGTEGSSFAITVSNHTRRPLRSALSTKGRPASAQRPTILAVKHRR
jgi:hypothetical protein